MATRQIRWRRIVLIVACALLAVALLIDWPTILRELLENALANEPSPYNG